MQTTRERKQKVKKLLGKKCRKGRWRKKKAVYRKVNICDTRWKTPDKEKKIKGQKAVYHK